MIIKVVNRVFDICRIIHIIVMSIGLLLEAILAKSGILWMAERAGGISMMMLDTVQSNDDEGLDEKSPEYKKLKKSMREEVDRILLISIPETIAGGFIIWLIIKVFF